MLKISQFALAVLLFCMVVNNAYHSVTVGVWQLLAAFLIFMIVFAQMKLDEDSQLPVITGLLLISVYAIIAWQLSLEEWRYLLYLPTFGLAAFFGYCVIGQYLFRQMTAKPSN